MSSIDPIADAGSRRIAVIDGCNALGLTVLAATISNGMADSHFELRRRLLTVREAATALIEEGEHIEEDRYDLAEKLERDAAAGIVACDRVIAERAARQANPRNDRPVLSPVRLMGIRNGGEQ